MRRFRQYQVTDVDPVLNIPHGPNYSGVTHATQQEGDPAQNVNTTLEGPSELSRGPNELGGRVSHTNDGGMTGAG
jgi:hypothetical protein